MIKSNANSCTQILLDFDLKVIRQCLVIPCHWLIVVTFEHPTAMKTAVHLYSRKGFKYLGWGSKRRLWEFVVRDVAQGWLQPTLKCNPGYEAPQQEVHWGFSKWGSKKRLWELVVSFVWQGQLQQGVCHTVALPFALKSILRQKKNYENSTISPCENIIFKKSFKRNQNPSRNYNSIANLNFQHKPKYHLSKILI
jgi:hypothetical protein